MSILMGAITRSRAPFILLLGLAGILVVAGLLVEPERGERRTVPMIGELGEVIHD